jgi:hypothetical protein
VLTDGIDTENIPDQGEFVEIDPKSMRVFMYPVRVDQCDLDQQRHLLACAGRGTIAVLRLHPGAAPTMVATLATKHPIHTLAFDPKTGCIWAVWASATGSGDYMQRFRVRGRV